MIGTNLGQYRIIEQIGRGGMATVYRAYQASTDRDVAIKVLPDSMATEPEFPERFEREARVVAKLQHPHILPVFDYGIEQNTSYLVMPYIPKGDLKQFIKTRPHPLDEIAGIFGKIATALDYAHQQGVLHRDIKPDNILFDASNNPLIADFGLTRMTEGSNRLTGSMILGTPAYMSPEQGQGLPLDHRSDIYSMGILLYEMVTGEVPFSADTPVAVIFKHVSAPLPLPREKRLDLSEAAQNVILKSLSKLPEHRFDTCGEMAQAFFQAISVSTDSHDGSSSTYYVDSSESEPTLPGLIDSSTRILRSHESSIAPPKALSQRVRLIAVGFTTIILAIVAFAGLELARQNHEMALILATIQTVTPLNEDTSVLVNTPDTSSNVVSDAITAQISEDQTAVAINSIEHTPTPMPTIQSHELSEPTTNSSAESMQTTGVTVDNETLTSSLSTTIPTIAVTSTETPISASDIQETQEAENAPLTATSIMQTEVFSIQQTLRVVLTEQFIDASTATYIAQLSATPLATNTLTATLTPVHTATNTPTRTPRPTRTSIPPSPTSTSIPDDDLLYSEDFEDGFIDGVWLLNQDWEIQDDGTGNRVLVIPESIEADVYIIDSSTWRNYAAELEYRIVNIRSTRTIDALSFVVRSEDFGACPSYYARIYHDYVNFFRSFQNCSKDVIYGEGGLNTPKNKWHTVRIEVLDDLGKVRLFVNNRPIFQGTDDTLLRGYIGFSTAGEVHFDNFRVWSLEESE